MDTERKIQIRLYQKVLELIPYRKEKTDTGPLKDFTFRSRQNIGFSLECMRNEDRLHGGVRNHIRSLIRRGVMIGFESIILPSQIIEHFINQDYARKENRFDAWLRYFSLGFSHEGFIDEWEHWNDEGKARYARWVCATAAEDLKIGTRTADNQRLQQSLVLTARRAIRLGEQRTEFHEGIPISTEWLGTLMNVVLNPDIDLTEDLKWKFINDPPRKIQAA